MMRKLLFTVAFTMIAFPAKAKDIYIAQTAAGAGNGADCADALVYTFFNSSANWGSGSTQIGPGTTVHICGVLTAAAGSSNYLMFRGSGSNGNPVTLKFETGAVISAPYWSGPVIDLAGNSYVTVDGGTNGMIQATANGTALANQQDNGECVNNGSPGASSTNVTVQNLTCSNMYVDSSPADNGGEDTYGIDLWNVSNLTIQNNTVHDVKWGIRNSFAVGSIYSNVTISGNNVYNMDHGYFMGDSNSSGSAVLTNLYVYGNRLGSMTNWDNTADNNHHDWIHLNTNSASTRFSQIYVYDNSGSGDIGANANAGFFSFPASTSAMTNVYFFNNLYVNTSTNHCWANGFISWYLAGSLTAVNNTFVSDASSCQDNGLDYNNGSVGLTFENNIVQNAQNAAIYATSGVSIPSLDYNNYYQSSSWTDGSTSYATLAAWRTATGWDANSSTTNAELAASYQPTSFSSALTNGINLTALCSTVSQLCTDKAGNSRPSTGGWYVGAYQFTSGTAPQPATGLTAVAH